MADTLKVKKMTSGMAGWIFTKLQYKKELNSFQNNPKKLDPSYKKDLDLWDCLVRVKLVD